MSKLLWVVALTSAGIARGDAAVELRQLFPREADVFVDQTGLSQLQLPPEVLRDCRPDLSDLRMFDPGGAVVPFVVDRGTPAVVEPPVTQLTRAKVLKAYQEEIPRGTGRPLRRETFELVVPERVPEGSSWELVLQTAREHFAARVEVEAVDESGRKTSLVPNGSVFRLPRADAEATRVSLPPFLAKRLSLVVSSEEDKFLEPRIYFNSAYESAKRRQVVLALDSSSSHRAEGKSVLELARPGAITPNLLRASTSTGNFDRRVRVYDVGPGAREVIAGEGTLFRLGGYAPMERLEIALAAVRGDRLRVEIEDGDSPPLKDLTFEAVVDQPSLIFEAAAPNPQPPAAVLRFGGGRAHLPHYDLGRLLGSEGRKSDERVARFGAARLGEIRANPQFDAKPALAFAMKPGAELDLRIYTHERLLHLEASRDGLARVRLNAEDLALARSDTADVRIVDSAHRQWPYLLEPRAASIWIRLQPAAAKPRAHESHYVFALPIQHLAADQLWLETKEPYFDREYKLLGADLKGEQILLARGRLVRGGGRPDSIQRPLMVEISPQEVKSLELVVSDGDDAALAWSGARVRTWIPELYLVAPPGDYEVLIGNPEATAPAYEISHWRDTLLALEGSPAVLGPLKENPSYQRRARLASGSGPQSVLLWSVLGLAVVFLLVITLRLARHEASPTSGDR